MRRSLVSLLALALTLALISDALAQKKKKKKGKTEEEEQTQTLELPPEPPAAVTADTARLVFQVTPLSAKGLLSQQVRDGLKWLLRRGRGGGVVSLRAFVAGSGDMRRVPAIVSEVFTDKKLPLPAVSVVQVGQLPLEGAQVVIESIAMEKKAVNPNGLAFLSGQEAVVDQPLRPVPPLVDRALGRLRLALQGAGAEPGGVLRATCYVSSLDEADTVRQRMATQFPKAALNLVQRMREPLQSLAECEAVARLQAKPPSPLSFVSPPELGPSPGQSAAALVAPGRIAITGTQMAFGYTEADARLAFQRLGKALEQVKGDYRDAAVARFYTLSRPISELVRKVRPEFFDPARPPAATLLPFEGLPSLDAAFAVDVVAVIAR